MSVSPKAATKPEKPEETEIAPPPMKAAGGLLDKTLVDALTQFDTNIPKDVHFGREFVINNTAFSSILEKVVQEANDERATPGSVREWFNSIKGAISGFISSGTNKFRNLFSFMSRSDTSTIETELQGQYMKLITRYYVAAMKETESEDSLFHGTAYLRSLFFKVGVFAFPITHNTNGGYVEWVFLMPKFYASTFERSLDEVKRLYMRGIKSSDQPEAQVQSVKSAIMPIEAFLHLKRSMRQLKKSGSQDRIYSFGRGELDRGGNDRIDLFVDKILREPEAMVGSSLSGEEEVPLTDYLTGAEKISFAKHYYIASMYSEDQTPMLRDLGVIANLALSTFVEILVANIRERYKENNVYWKVLQRSVSSSGAISYSATGFASADDAFKVKNAFPVLLLTECFHSMKIAIEKTPGSKDSESVTGTLEALKLDTPHFRSFLHCIQKLDDEACKSSVIGPYRGFLLPPEQALESEGESIIPAIGGQVVGGEYFDPNFNSSSYTLNELLDILKRHRREPPFPVRGTNLEAVKQYEETVLNSVKQLVGEKVRIQRRVNENGNPLVTSAGPFSTDTEFVPPTTGEEQEML